MYENLILTFGLQRVKNLHTELTHATIYTFITSLKTRTMFMVTRCSISTATTGECAFQSKRHFVTHFLIKVILEM